MPPQQNNRYYRRNHHKKFSLPFLHWWLVKDRVPVYSCLWFAFSSTNYHLCNSTTALWSELEYICKAYYSRSCFPAGTEIGVVPPQWYIGRICRADLRRWQPCSVFSWQGAVSNSGWLTLSSSWGLNPEHLGHPYSLLPTCTLPTTGSVSKSARRWWCRVQSETEGNFMPSASGVRVCLQIKRVVQPSTTNYTDWTA